MCMVIRCIQCLILQQYNVSSIKTTATDNVELTTDFINRVIVEVCDKSEATRLAGLLVGNHRDTLNSTISGEIFLHVIFSCVRADAANEHFLHPRSSTRTGFLYQ